MIPELSLLITICARERGLIPKRPFRYRPGQGINEERLLKLADMHGVIGLVYKGLISWYPNLLTAHSLDILRMKTLYKRILVERLLSEWPGLIQAVERAGIPVLTFKGPALALQLFGLPDSREYCDLDLLVLSNRHGLNSIIRNFEERGYRLYIDNLPYSQTQRRLLLRKTTHLILVNDQKHTVVEIHSKGFGPLQGLYSVPIKEIFQRCRIVEWNNERFLSLGKEDNTICILAHGAKHAWAYLKWILDAAILLRDNRETDWNTLWHKMEILGLERALAASIAFIRTLFDLPLPNEVCRYIEKNGNVIKRIVFSASRFFCGKISYPVQTNTEKLSLLLYQLMLKKSISYKLYTLIKRLIPAEKEFELLSIPGPFSFLYWIIRPLRFALGGKRF